MSRVPLALAVPDAAQFARALGRSLAERHAAGAAPPGHVELLNLFARALGHRNLQALRAAGRATPLPLLAVAAEDRPPAAPLSANARKALQQFDARGRLLRWPTKYSVQVLAMWVLWTLFDGRRVYTEREVNQILAAANAFGDHATLRRELVDHRLMTRKSDCSEYRKLPARPDAEVRALLAAWRALRRGQPGAQPASADTRRPARDPQRGLPAASAG